MYTVYAVEIYATELIAGCLVPGNKVQTIEYDNMDDAYNKWEEYVGDTDFLAYVKVYEVSEDELL